MSNDSQLQKAVLDELSWEPSVVAAHIGVTANAGVVTLSGHVDSYVQKFAAEKAARRVKGVKAVAEELEVRLNSVYERGDPEIAAAAVERLAWDVSLVPGSVQVKVENGWVTLTGQVDWFFERYAAEQDVRRLFGVTGVSNQIAIKVRPDVTNISENIRTALHRSWFKDSEQIKVSALGGAVTLRGKVTSLHDRQLASTTAWAAPGTVTVDNEISVV